MYNLFSRNFCRFFIGMGMSFIFSLVPDVSYAFKWPVVLDVKVELIGPEEAVYTGNWTVIEVDDSLDTDTRLKYTGIIHRHKSDTGAIEAGTMDYQTELKVNNADCPNSIVTLSCIGQKWIEKNGESGTYKVHHDSGPNGNECVAIATVNQTFGSVWDQRVYPSTGATQCIGTPPVNNFCALTQDKIEFAYGPLTVKTAAGKELTKNINVECTDDIPYVLRLRGNDKIPLDNGMHAELTTNNGEPLGETLSGQQGVNIIELTSELKGTPNRTGSFYGSGVLFVTYP